MEVMQATIARKMTMKAIEEKRARMLDMMNTRIMTNISLGKFECDFLIDSSTLQDELFDYFTSLGYAVRFSPAGKRHILEYPNSRVMTISWEDAVQ